MNTSGKKYGLLMVALMILVVLDNLAPSEAADSREKAENEEKGRAPTACKRGDAKDGRGICRPRIGRFPQLEDAGLPGNPHIKPPHLCPDGTMKIDNYCTKPQSKKECMPIEKNLPIVKQLEK